MKDDDFNPLVPLIALGMGWLMCLALPGAIIAHAVLGTSRRRSERHEPRVKRERPSLKIVK